MTPRRGTGGFAAAAVLASGAWLVDRLLPVRADAPRAADDPGEVRDRLLRALALTAVVMLAGRAAGRPRRHR